MNPRQHTDAIATWRPTRHVIDDDTADRLATETRLVVGSTDWSSASAAKLACGHVFRYFAWAERAASAGSDGALVEQYLAHLAQQGAPKGTLKPVAAALRRCVAPTEAPRPAPRTATDAIAGYTPDPQRVAPEIWVQIEEVARAAVTLTAPSNPRQAVSRLAPTSLYLAWSTAIDRKRQQFSPPSVERFLAAGRSAWTPATHRTYTSTLRLVARTVEPSLWPTDRTSRRTAALCDLDELETIARTIRRRTPTERRHLSALVLLARGAGITGTAAALIRPGDITDCGDSITVAVTTGRAQRTVAVITEWAQPLAELAERSRDAGDQHLLGGRGAGGAANRSAALAGRHTELTGVAIEPTTLRNTWLAWLIHQPLGLPQMLSMAGLRSTTPLDAVLRAGTVDDDPARLTRIAHLL